MRAANRGKSDMSLFRQWSAPKKNPPRQKNPKTMNSHNGHKVHKAEKFWLALSPLSPAWTLCESQARRGLLFLLPRILAPSNESNYRIRDAHLFRRGQHLSLI